MRFNCLGKQTEASISLQIRIVHTEDEQVPVAIELIRAQQVHGFLYSADDRSEAAAKIYYKLTMDSKKESSENFQLDRRRASEFRITYSDLRVSYDESDTFEHILNVTSHNDALLAYYYLDSDNKVRLEDFQCDVIK
ncbi:hypothetical protein ACJJTC_000101 [Scirpophaga incertulas]